jgi:hypothetical protein
MATSERPPGFTSWLDFSSPEKAAVSISGSDGERDLLSVQQHELVAWLMTMRFLCALEWIAAESVEAPSSDQFKLERPSRWQQQQTLPLPVREKGSGWYAWYSLAFGHGEDPEIGHAKWTMEETECRTSFDSMLPSNLQDLILSGAVEADDSVLLLRSTIATENNAGWVLDMDVQPGQEQHASTKNETHEAIDRKKAYRGISTSGTLRMLIPITIKKEFDVNTPVWNKEMKKKKKKKLAEDYVSRLVVCQFTRTHRPDGCRFPNDLVFRVGGIAAPASIISPEIVTNPDNACVTLAIPRDARLIPEPNHGFDNS